MNLLVFLYMAMIALFRRLAHGSLRGSLPPREVANENALPNQKPCCLLAAFNGGGRNLPECPPPTGRDFAQYDPGCGFGVAHNMLNTTSAEIPFNRARLAAITQLAVFEAVNACTH